MSSWSHNEGLNASARLMETFRSERNDYANLRALLIALDASPVSLKRDLVRGEGRAG